jgi:hypothetical protein
MEALRGSQWPEETDSGANERALTEMVGAP